nr:hypothetical protein [Pectobacterium atrosepticum]
MSKEMTLDGMFYFAETMLAFTDQYLNNSAIVDTVHRGLVMIIE